MKHLFEIWVVRVTEGYSYLQVRKQMAIFEGFFFSSFLESNGIFNVLIRIASMRHSNEYTQHTISWWNKKMSLNICFLELSEEFHRDSKPSSNDLGNWAIGVRAIELRLYWDGDYIHYSNCPQFSYRYTGLISTDPDEKPSTCKMKKEMKGQTGRNNQKEFHPHLLAVKQGRVA